jgi:peptidyl-prolyl cis-trans isomerase SurA
MSHSTLTLRLLAGAFVVAGALVGAAPAAQAQGIVAQVNNRAITSLDVAQRVRIAAMTERRRLGTREALEELIDDQVKVIEAGRVGYRVTEEGVEAEFLKLAKANGQGTRQFEDTLRRAGLEPAAVRDKMRAGIAWNALLRDRVKLGSQVSSEEVEAAAREKKSKTGDSITQYTLIPVVFIVPTGASPGSRVAAANAARSRFTSCETGFDALRTMPDVYVRPSITRTSDDLTPQLRQTFDKTPVGRMTAPAPGEQGIEVIAVCNKRQLNNPSGDKAAVAEELTEKKVQGGTKAYLAELRKKVTIKYHR